MAGRDAGAAHLKAMAPAMTFSSPRNFFYSNGVFDRSWLPWIYVNIAPDIRRKLDLPGARDSSEAAAAWPGVAAQYRSWLPLRDLPWLRSEAPFYFEWLAHPPEDPWWDWAELRGGYAKVTAAVLNLSGWYDEGYGPEGAATNFTAWCRREPGRATRERTWCSAHGSTVSDRPASGASEISISGRLPRSTMTRSCSISSIITCAA